VTLRLQAVTIVVPDYDSAIAFFVGVLGFDLRADTPMPGGKRWVMVGPADGSCALLLARAADADQSAAIGRQTGGRVGFFLETDDFPADYARLLAAGVTFEEAPRHEEYGAVVVWRDPFGNRWDLLERRVG
jgi:catechol 2,3-dioxygenase-like lactoylglutathione lyase family enzyme